MPAAARITASAVANPGKMRAVMALRRVRAARTAVSSQLEISSLVDLIAGAKLHRHP